MNKVGIPSDSKKNAIKQRRRKRNHKPKPKGMGTGPMAAIATMVILIPSLTIVLSQRKKEEEMPNAGKEFLALSEKEQMAHIVDSAFLNPQRDAYSQFLEWGGKANYNKARKGLMARMPMFRSKHKKKLFDLYVEGLGADEKERKEKLLELIQQIGYRRYELTQEELYWDEQCITSLPEGIANPKGPREGFPMEEGALVPIFSNKRLMHSYWR